VTKHSVEMIQYAEGALLATQLFPVLPSVSILTQLLFPNPPPPTTVGTPPLGLSEKLINNRSRDFTTSQDNTDHEDIYVNGKISKGISIGNGQGGGKLHKIVRSHSAQVKKAKAGWVPSNKQVLQDRPHAQKER
jgi:hypothetical protein